MIESTTDFLDEALSGIQHLKFFDPIFKETLNRRETRAEQKREYVLRYACVQAHFLRTSYADKINFMTRMLEEVKSANAIMIMLSAVTQASGKMGTYVKTMTSTTFIYDKTFYSHNRSMDEETLREAQEEDLEWFRSLCETEKIPVIIGLIRMSSGAMILKMQEKLKPLLKQRLNSPDNVNFKFSEAHIPQKIGWRLDEKLNELVKGDYEEIQYDPKDPLTIEVEKMRRRWNEKMAMYVAQVEANEQKNKSAEKTGKNKENVQKKPSKKESKKDSKKGSKKGKKKQEGSGIDRIQLLPVWIIKKILGYLDKKTLETCKKVNEYWKYIITDYLKETATRAKLDKEMKKIEENFTHEYGKFKPQPQTPRKVRTSFQQKRFLKLTETACCSEKVRTQLYEPHNKSLISTAPKLLKNRYLLPVKYLLSFPRSTCTPYKLYRPRSAICIGNNYLHTIRGNLVVKRSSKMDGKNAANFAQ